MSDIAIRVEHLSKLYTMGRAQQRYGAGVRHQGSGGRRQGGWFLTRDP